MCTSLTRPVSVVTRQVTGVGAEWPVGSHTPTVTESTEPQLLCVQVRCDCLMAVWGRRRVHCMLEKGSHLWMKRRRPFHRCSTWGDPIRSTGRYLRLNKPLARGWRGGVNHLQRADSWLCLLLVLISCATTLTLVICVEGVSSLVPCLSTYK